LKLLLKRLLRSYGMKCVALEQVADPPGGRADAGATVQSGVGAERASASGVEHMTRDRRGYLYRSFRDGGRVRRRYFGKGPVADLVAQLEPADVAARAEDCRRQGAEWQEELERLRAIDDLVAQLAGLTERMAHIAFEVTGHHRHKRQWRRRRVGGSMGETATDVVKAPAHLDAVPASIEALESLWRRARDGDEAARETVLRCIAQLPEPAIKWFGGDLAVRAERKLAERVAGDDWAALESILARCRRQREELAGQNPTAIERLLVERVIAARLVVEEAELRLAAVTDLTFRQAEYQQRRLDRAHRRLLAALRVLAQVRRLALPVLVAQVNVGPQQANVVVP
jgi:hypothetical protein